MKLREFQAKEIFSRCGIAVPRGRTAKSPQDAGKAARELNGPVVLKPQLGVKGRGKAGGIAFAADWKSAMKEASRLFNMSIKGESIKTLLVEEKLPIAEELYLAVSVDYAHRGPVLIASLEGGVQVEEAARENPERVIKIMVNILEGPLPHDYRKVAEKTGKDAADYLAILYQIFRKYDAEMVEINPLARTYDGGLIAADAVLNVGDESLFRHEDLQKLKKEIPIEDPIAEEASQKNWTYIDLPGDIGILSSGAGLTMAILDMLNKAGGNAANFLDTAQIDEEGIYDAFELLLRAKTTRVILINIFAGLNRCDHLALGIRRFLEEHPARTPLVVRMIGNMEDEGHNILKLAGIEPFIRIEDAIERAVRIAKGKRP